MAVFNYKAREKDGTIVSGTIEAAERRLAMQRLQAKGAQPSDLKGRSHWSTFYLG